MDNGGEEKMTAVVQVRCYPSEKERWIERISRRDLSRKIRELLNALTEKGKRK